jgi:hypothetical protein
MVSTGILNVLKPLITPTYRPKLEAQKTCDIVFIKADPFCRVCLFCNIVRNTIYVLEIEMLGPLVLARYLQNSQNKN